MPGRKIGFNGNLEIAGVKEVKGNNRNYAAD